MTGFIGIACRGAVATVPGIAVERDTSSIAPVLLRSACIRRKHACSLPTDFVRFARVAIRAAVLDVIVNIQAQIVDACLVTALVATNRITCFTADWCPGCRIIGACRQRRHKDRDHIGNA